MIKSTVFLIFCAVNILAFFHAWGYIISRPFLLSLSNFCLLERNYEILLETNLFSEIRPEVADHRCVLYNGCSEKNCKIR